ncbi:MAG: alpha-hydroxy-acid oxidizing protein [Lachnospiraceae bacterium]|nr:alpha-hydroxy-acid oxidizing protein [Lachnospiraceae bacterium]
MKNNSDSITRDYFDSLLVEMRHIDGVKPDSRCELLGEMFEMPIATAALSHLNNTCEDGMKKMAEGAKMAGALCFSGMGEKTEIEDMCNTGAKVVKIIKPHKDEKDVFKEIKDAETAGAFAVGMDVDHAFSGDGEYDVVFGLDMRPQSMEQLKKYIEATKLPFIIKGILSVSDAKKALELGAAGIVVSHHHGILDYCVPPLMILPKIVEEVGGQMTVFVDCCMENGMDVYKALALGADGVCVGRGIMGPLKENGAEGVAEKMKNMNKELKGAMARTGFGQIGDIDSSILHKREF